MILKYWDGQINSVSLKSKEHNIILPSMTFKLLIETLFRCPVPNDILLGLDTPKYVI